jgi:hypothetical protein
MCIAVWDMDEASYQIRPANGGDCDAAGSSCDLDLGYAGIVKSSTYFQQGTGSAEFDAAESLGCADATCTILDFAGNDITWGGWFRVTSDAGALSMILNTSSSNVLGYRLTRNATSDDLRCGVGDGTDSVTTDGTANWTVDAYHHAICTHDGTNTIASYFNGVADATASQGPVAADAGVFYVSSVGQDDEVFVYDAAFTAAEACRTTRCGIHGELCICDGAVPTQFKACSTDSDCRVAGNTTAICNTGYCTGRTDYDSCSSMGDCNAGAPT